MDPHALRTSARLMDLERWDRHERLQGGRSQLIVAWHQDKAYVVKAYDPAVPSAGAREKAALRALDGAGGAPRWYAHSDDPPLVVMSRIEGSSSLADALLGASEQPAHETLLAWADALAVLHDAGSSPVRESFVAGLDQHAQRLDPRSLPGDFAAASDRYATILDQLGLPGHDHARDELRELPATLADEEWEVLSPGDTCPDNNVVGAHGMHLLDLEHAELRHAAWDVAYLRAPWPSCWCAWRLPDDVTDAAVRRYCQQRGERFSGTTFGSAIELATLGWQLMTPAFFIPGALEDDDSARSGRPSRRSFVLHRLAQAARTDIAPSLSVLARNLHDVLRERWGEVPLELAPAFR